MENSTRVWGLDIGPNSIGWAIIDYRQPIKKNDPEPIGLIDTNVRIFTEGVNRTPQGAEQSKNAARRAARSLRRTHQRKNKRRGALKALLQEAGLLPEDGEIFSKLLLQDPYMLRSEGLDRKLDLHEFGRVLYHLVQRRGFKSNRKSESKKEDGQIAQGVNALAKEINDSGCRTLGEYLYKTKASGAPVRFRHIENAVPNRSMYENEFDLLWTKQIPYHPSVLGEKLKGDIYDAIFFQRPFDIRERWGRNLERLPHKANARRAPELGRCEYEPLERKSPRSSWWAQRFRMLQDINNLKITDTATGEVRDLSVEERASLVLTLGKVKERSFDQIRKLLGLAESCRFNLEDGKRAKLKGNSTEWNMRQAFKGDYDELSPEIRDEVVLAMLDIEDKDILTHRAMKEWGLGEEGAKRLASSPLEGGYLNLSIKALRKLVPHLEEGWDYMKAVDLAGYQRRDQRSVDAAGSIGVDDLPGITNPLVSSALFEVRKVINSLVSAYGVPSEIRVELVRDLKNSRERRQEIMWEQRENERRNEDAVKRLQEDFGIASPKPDQVLRYKLWEECGHECPYTGRAIPDKALLSTDIEVEHIIPYSRSLDDSYMNKTLCYAGENRLKEDKIPFEFYGHDEKRWDEVLRRVKKLPGRKQDRFYLKEIQIDFISRQLNDTAYIAREVRSLLEKVAGKNNVQIAAGQSTATLRRLWGLNTVLSKNGEKNRADHRHHAIDAVVVALTTPGLLKRLSMASAGERRVKVLPLPWNGFRDEVKDKVDGIVISHRVRRKVSGSLHEETNYGILKKKDRKGQPLYALRKPLSILTKNDIKLIADEKVRAIIRKHLIDHGSDPDNGSHKEALWKKAMDPLKTPPPTLENKNGPPVPIKKVRLHRVSNGMEHIKRKQSKKQIKRILPKDEPYRAVKTGSNHHIVIYEYIEGEKMGRWGTDDDNIVSMFEASTRLKNREPVIRRDLGEGKRFVMSLSKGEMIVTHAGEATEFYRVQEIDAGNKRIGLRKHLAATDEEDFYISPNELKKRKTTKVVLDPIGRIRKAND